MQKSCLAAWEEKKHQHLAFRENLTRESGGDRFFIEKEHKYRAKLNEKDILLLHTEENLPRKK